MRAREAAAATSIDDLKRRAANLNFTYFTDYAVQPETKEREFRAGLSAIGLTDLSERTVLDIGPGLGDSLNAARKMGAARTVYLDSEPMFSRYLDLNGHKGWTTNYMSKPYYPADLKGHVDLIWTKGSINCDAVNAAHEKPFSRAGLVNRVRGFDYVRWIMDMKSMLRPGGHILLIPAMGRRQTEIVDPDYDVATFHWCEDVPAFKRSFFSQTLFDHGFEPVEGVKYYNQPLSFPLGFHFNKS